VGRDDEAEIDLDDEPGSIVLNIRRYIGISAEIPVFYPKRYDKCKILPDIILDRYGSIYRHVAG